MGFYFHKDGRPNLRFLTAQSLVLAAFYLHAEHVSLKKVQDNSMSPYFQTAVKPTAGFLQNLYNTLFYTDIVLYKHFPHNQKSSELKGKIIAI